MKKKAHKKLTPIQPQKKKAGERKNYLSHYLVLRFAGESYAIGEASEVRTVRKGVWKARVGIWAKDPKTKQHYGDREHFCEVRVRTVHMPVFGLVRKTRFRGTIGLPKERRKSRRRS